MACSSLMDFSETSGSGPSGGDGDAAQDQLDAMAQASVTAKAMAGLMACAGRRASRRAIFNMLDLQRYSGRVGKHATARTTLPPGRFAMDGGRAIMDREQSLEGKYMVVVIVTHRAPKLAPGALRALLEATAPSYREVPGLRRKYFIGNGETAGGVYEWMDRLSAERWFDTAWRARMRDRYGIDPQVDFYEAPALVDNVTGELLLDC